MLQDIEHKNERVPLLWLEIAIKWANMDATAVNIVWANQLGARFNSFHVTKLRKLVKKETVSATNV